MKKIILLPIVDTVILCLPEEWVGIPIECKLFPISKKVKAKEKNKEQKNEKHNKPV